MWFGRFGGKAKIDTNPWQNLNAKQLKRIIKDTNMKELLGNVPKPAVTFRSNPLPVQIGNQLKLTMNWRGCWLRMRVEFDGNFRKDCGCRFGLRRINDRYMLKSIGYKLVILSCFYLKSWKSGDARPTIVRFNTSISLFFGMNFLVSFQVIHLPKRFVT